MFQTTDEQTDRQRQTNRRISLSRKAPLLRCGFDNALSVDAGCLRVQQRISYTKEKLQINICIRKIRVVFSVRGAAYQHQYPAWQCSLHSDNGHVLSLHRRMSLIVTTPRKACGGGIMFSPCPVACPVVCSMRSLTRPQGAAGGGEGDRERSLISSLDHNILPFCAFRFCNSF